MLILSWCLQVDPSRCDGREVLMRLEDKWKALADFILDLKKRNVNVPPKIVTALTCCKSLINHCRHHINNRGEPVEFQKIMTQLARDVLDIESSLIIIAVDRLGEEYALEWSMKLGEKTLT